VVIVVVGDAKARNSDDSVGRCLGSVVCLHTCTCQACSITDLSDDDLLSSVEVIVFNILLRKVFYNAYCSPSGSGPLPSSSNCTLAHLNLRLADR
jgi:hypothetical protein